MWPALSERLKTPGLQEVVETKVAYRDAFHSFYVTPESNNCFSKVLFRAYNFDKQGIKNFISMSQRNEPLDRPG
jgi:hypothetical protein